MKILGLITVIMLLLINCKSNNLETITCEPCFSNIEFDTISNFYPSEQIVIKNCYYSTTEIKYKDSLTSFILRKNITTDNRGNQEIKLEFLDNNLKRQFQIECKQREIVLFEKLYLTYGITNTLAKAFELNNYETGKSFIEGRGKFIKVEVPKIKTEIFIGWKETAIDTNIVGTVYFSVNQKQNYKINLVTEDSEFYEFIEGGRLNVSIFPDREYYSCFEFNDLINYEPYILDENNKGDFYLIIEYSKNSSTYLKKIEIPIINCIPYGKILKENLYEEILK